MDDDNLMDVNFTDLDLNQEPISQSVQPAQSVAESILNELEATSVRRYHRLMQLEAVIQRHERRRGQNPVVIPPFPSETIGLIGNGVSLDGNSDVEVLERSGESGRGFKRDSSHLVADNLEKDSDVKEEGKDGGSFYDCSICLEMANDPVVTVCGHLFCWPCFYQVSHIDSAKKECPVCKGEVSDNSVIPIYGNGGGDRVYESEYGLKIPPRPKAKRIESIRQQILTGDFSQVYVAAAMRRIRISLAMDGTETRGGQNVEEAGGARARIQQASRVLSETADSLSSLTSAGSATERLIAEIELAVDGHLSQELATSVDDGSTSVVPSNDQLPDVTVDDQATSSTDVSSSHHARLISAVQRRRSNIARVMDFYGRDAREARRRRLN